MKTNELGNLHVLIVDDEKAILELVHDVLGKLGFTNVVVARNGLKAMELLSAHKFDFMITDWRMGEPDGIDIVRFVRTNPASFYPMIPIIMLTGNTEAREVMTARDVGVDAYIIKPFSAEQLASRIRNIIEHPREYIVTKTYTGPNRRFHNVLPPNGIERRKNRNQPNSRRP